MMLQKAAWEYVYYMQVLTVGSVVIAAWRDSAASSFLKVSAPPSSCSAASNTSRIHSACLMKKPETRISAAMTSLERMNPSGMSMKSAGPAHRMIQGLVKLVQGWVERASSSSASGDDIDKLCWEAAGPEPGGNQFWWNYLNKANIYRSQVRPSKRILKWDWPYLFQRSRLQTHQITILDL